MQISVDGRAVELHETVAYKGMMFSGIPNLAAAMGYTNASWTLKCDLVCAYVCRLLGRMDELGVRQVTPRWPGGSLRDSPFIDLTSGYVMRSIDKFPKQGRRSPWRLYQNYIRDIVLLKRAPLDDGAVEFSNPVPAGRPAERVAV
jgi:hypothetical protein